MLRLIFRLVGGGVAVAAVAAIVLQRLPPEHLPFAPLDLAQPIGLATAMKLGRLDADPAGCRRLLTEAGVGVAAEADRRTGPFCGYRNVLTLRSTPVRWSAPVTATCPLLATLLVWERQVVQPAAARHFGVGVVAIDHVGTYACRAVNTGSPAATRPSQHATANAIDIVAFRLADGRRIDVAGDWTGAPAARAFLRAVRDGGCRLFPAVLGPDHNALHADHFHLDRGPHRICR